MMRRALMGAVTALAAVGALAAPAVKKPAPAKAPVRPAAPMAFKPAVLDLAPGETYPVELFVPSPTGKAFSGALDFEVERGLTVSPDSRWKGSVPGWGLKTYPKLTAAPDATGEYALKASIGSGAAVKQSALKVRIVRPTIELDPGVFKLTLKVTNPFASRLLNGRITVSNPDRFLQDVTTREFKIEPGKTQDLEIPLPGAAPVCGETYDFTLTVETYQGYKEKKTYPLAFPPHT